jgi:hypothetical protein
VRELDRLVLQPRLGIGEVDEPDLLGLLAVEGIAGERVVHAVAEVQGLSDVPRHDAAGQDAPVHLGEAEYRLVGRDREIAGADLGEAAAEAVAVDHGDGRLREGRQLLPAPLIGGAAGLAAQHRIGIAAAEIELDVLAGAERLARPGEHDDLGLRIDRQLFERIVHIEVELRAHGVALVRSVHDQPSDAVLLLDQDRLVFLRRHRFSPGLLDPSRRDRGIQLRVSVGAFDVVFPAVPVRRRERVGEPGRLLNNFLIGTASSAFAAQRRWGQRVRRL